MEATKRKYQKHIIGGKVSLKHYLFKNKNKDEVGNLYSIYIQITLKRQTSQFKSKVSNSGGIEEKGFGIDEVEMYKEAICRDKDLINYIITKLKPFDKVDSNVKDIIKVYNQSWLDLEYLFDNLLMWEIDYFFRKRNVFVDVKPISYVGYHQDNDPKIKENASKFTSKIWYLDAIINHLKHGVDSYFIFPPTIHDFVSGKFENDLIKYKILSEEDTTHLISDMKKLYDTYENELWQ